MNHISVQEWAKDNGFQINDGWLVFNGTLVCGIEDIGNHRLGSLEFIAREVNAFDRWATQSGGEDYDAKTVSSEWISVGTLINLMRPFLQDGQVVLDVGAGTGQIGQCLTDIMENIKLDGLDLSSEMLKKAEERCIYEQLICANVRQYSIRSLPLRQQYDVIISSGTFGDYVHHTWLPGFLDLVAKNGVVGISGRADRIYPIKDKNGCKSPRELLEERDFRVVRHLRNNAYVFPETGEPMEYCYVVAVRDNYPKVNTSTQTSRLRQRCVASS